MPWPYPDELRELAQLPQVHTMLWTVEPDGEQWTAEVQAGRRDGAFPRWGGQGNSRAEALGDAARKAYAYWTLHTAGVAHSR